VHKYNPMSVNVRMVKGSRFVEFTAEDGQPNCAHVESDDGLCLVMQDEVARACVDNLRADGWKEDPQ